MEYVKGTPFFCQGERIEVYPYLDEDISTDLLIVGGGIDGAIANYYLSQKYDVTLVDKSRFGFGCTSCSTILLEYQLDDYAEDLMKVMSEEEIVAIYKMGLDSIDMIEKFIKRHGNHCDFAKRPSFMYTRTAGGVKDLQKEFEFRKKHGFKGVLYQENDNPFPFSIKAGLYCEDGGAEFNPYLFTKQMIECANNQKNLYEFTDIDKIYQKGDEIIAETSFGNKITCNKIILATGFNFDLMKEKDLCERVVSYSIVTNPIENLNILNNALLQDDEEPYHYMRILPDKRIILGGEDKKFKNEAIDEKLAQKCYKKLKKDLICLFPSIKNDLRIDYQFCGAFGLTENNLGLIGKSENEKILYLLSCGANGVINAMFGTKLLDDIIENRKNPLEKLFSPLRNN